MLEPSEKSSLLALTGDIVTSHLSGNQVAANDVPRLISSVFSALEDLKNSQAPEPEQAPLVPAVSIRASVKPDYLVCLEDGLKFKMLARHLMTKYNLTPKQYKAKWGLPDSYPMVAPNYSQRRRELAISIGLGRTASKAVKPIKKKP